MRTLTFIIALTLLIITYILPQKAGAHSETQVIEMTADGFEPSEITVDENTTLNFVNRDGVDHWPASDIHPTHYLYPEFDPKKPIAPGDFWIFKPKKIGAWKFHDHLFPHERGVLTVTGESSETKMETSLPEAVPTKSASVPATTNPKNSFWQAVQSFFEKVLYYFVQGIGRVLGISPEPVSTTTEALPTLTSEKFKSLSPADQITELKSFASQSGAETAWKLVRETYKGVGGTSGGVHDAAHLSGQLLYEEQGFSALAACTPDFAFGCFHGFLDTAFSKDLEKLSDAESACGKLGSGVSGPVASCIHGIGHGVASFYQTSELQKALGACDGLIEAARTYCYDGVFMEFERNAAPTFYKSESPLFPCDTLAEKYMFACGRNQPQVLLRRFNKSFAEVAKICLMAKNTDFKAACVDALGFLAASTGGGIAEKVVALCQQITDQVYQAKCVRAAAGEIVFQEMPNWYVSSYQVCGSLSEAASRDCRGYIEQLMSEYGRLRPRTQGEDPDSYIASQMRICTRHGGRDDCYQKIAGFMSVEFDMRTSLEILKNNEGVPEVYARCHEVTHYLARSEYEKSKSVPQAYAQCDSTCHGGCYHGVLEAYMKEKQTDLGSDVESEFTKICGNIKDYEKPLVFYECLHGLGHAAMYITDMEVPLALTLCDSIATVELRERCYSGAFMENSSSSTSTDHPGKYVRADDPMYPCNTLSEKYLSLCYRYQSSHFSLITRQDWKAVANLCLQVPPNFRHDCFRTIGTNQVGFTQDYQIMKRNCYEMPPEFQETCVAGVIGSLAYRFVGDISKMTAFCQLVNPGHYKGCYFQIGSAVVDWSSDTQTQKRYCEAISAPQYVDWCKHLS